ncbi:MAG: hypothetical protein LIO45_04010 [Clostridiales bacterium]|nr:hypothetical protein [Clostridiales bacterium]
MATVTGTSYTDASLTEYNTNYYYTVRAYTTLNGTTCLSGYNSSGVVYHYLATPKLSSVSTASAGLKVSWSSVSGATKYYVYRKTSNSSGWTKMATVTGATTWTDTTAKSGTVYIYTVRAGSANGTSWYDTAGVSGVWLSTPTLSSASSTSTGVKVQWEAVSGAAGYRVYRKTAGGHWKTLATVTGTSYTDTSLTAYDTNYYYTVRAYTTLNGTTWLSGYDSSGVMLHYLAVPQLDEASSNESGITVSWLAVSGATSYCLYRKTDGAKWTCIATLDDDCTSYTDTTGVSGTTYYYTVRAQSADGISWYDTAGVSAICQ